MQKQSPEQDSSQRAPAGRRREEEAACWNASMVIATEERSLPFEKLSALRFLWFQFQRNFNCKENFVISLGGEGSTASKSPCLMRLLLQTSGFHTLAARKLAGDWWREEMRQASLLLSRAGETEFASWGGLDQVLHEAFSASLSMGPGYLCQAHFVLRLACLFEYSNKSREDGLHPLILEQAPHGGPFESSLKKFNMNLTHHPVIPLQNIYGRDKGTNHHTETGQHGSAKE